jgi:hypothetical protein
LAKSGFNRRFCSVISFDLRFHLSNNVLIFSNSLILDPKAAINHGGQERIDAAAFSPRWILNR